MNYSYSPKDLIEKFGLKYTFNDVILEPQYSCVESRKDVDISTKLNDTINLKLPILSANMKSVTEAEMAIALAKLGGLPILHRFCTIEENKQMYLKYIQHFTSNDLTTNMISTGYTIPNIGISIGTDNCELDRDKALFDLGATVFCLDVAHADSIYALRMLESLKAQFDNKIFIIAGNVSVYRAVERLVSTGADCVKIGIGSGHVCSTRIVTGHGVPALSAIIDCSLAAKELGKTTIADGGIRTSGDIVKSLAAGASAVMLGYILAGTDEASGTIINGHKEYIGSSIKEGKTPEGVNTLVSRSGPLASVVQGLVGGIQSGCSYSGVYNISELQEVARFIPISNASNVEGLPATLR
jgi:IMP dehydrogenase